MREPASIRSKNPGAMWFSDRARKWGATHAEQLNDGTGQNNNIAHFPTYVQGICAQLDLWRSSKHYKNKRFADAIAVWSGGNHVESYIKFVLERVPGMTRDTIMDDAFWRSSNGIAFLKAQAAHEAGKPYPAPEGDWFEAQRRVLGAPEPEEKPPHRPPDDGEEKPEPEKPDKPDESEQPKVPWYKRAWTWLAGSLFGGGLTLGGFQLTADALLAMSLLLIVIALIAAGYFIGRKKGWWP